MSQDAGCLEGKVAVVIGGGRGIGRATAWLLARVGATLVVAARTVSDCDLVAASIRQEGGRAFAVAADVADWPATQHLAAEVGRLAGPVDIVVISAGVIGPAGKVWEVAPDEWAANVRINLVGAFHAIRAFLPGMITGARRTSAGGSSHDAATVVLVSSAAARHVLPGASAYGAAKAGLDYLGSILQGELDLEGLPVSVYVVYPGIVDTPMQETIRGMRETEFPEVGRHRLLHEQGRLRPPEQPASLILWLAACAPPDLRGQVVALDDPGIRGRMTAELGLAPF
jgi:NAD(P)-dependent dehydrogenase (short-subunit alcohol dehydrogenase family)